MTNPLIHIRNLRIGFPAGGDVVHGLDLSIARGESVALVGESGSGKSVTARSLIGLSGPKAEVRASEFTIDGKPALGFSERDWRRVRGGKIGYVLQDALTSLDPLRRVGQLLGDAAGRRDTPAELELLGSVGIPEPETRLPQYPHELSGGLRQRTLIATAIARSPELIIADEPTTALDVTVQKQILDLLAARRRAGTALLLISHDLAVVSKLADRVLVMRDGVVVEAGPTREVLHRPSHAYTRQLLDAVPSEHSRGYRLAPQTTAPATAGQARRVPLPRAVPSDTVILEAKDLHKHYARAGVTAVHDVSFRLKAGEALGIVGESGSGKTTVARMVMGLVEPDRGEIRLQGQLFSNQPEALRRPLRAGVQLIAQDPLSSFDPRYTVQQIVGESLDTVGVTGPARAERVREVLDSVQLPARFLTARPRDLSGGQRQRVAIARAFAPRPRLIVADEPVSALDVSIQAQVIDLLIELQASSGTALLFISHDLGVVHHLTDRVIVMKNGRVVEEGDVTRVFAAPRADYTRDLIAAIPTLS